MEKMDQSLRLALLELLGELVRGVLLVLSELLVVDTFVQLDQRQAQRLQRHVTSRNDALGVRFDHRFNFWSPFGEPCR